MKNPNHVVVVDFDGTLIPNSYGSLRSFVDKNGGLTGELFKKSMILRSKFLPQALAGETTSQDEKDWMLESISFYVKSELTIPKVEDILKDIKLRNGVEEFIDFLTERGVPIAVISYGILDFIEVILRNHHLAFCVDDIMAVRLDLEYTGLKVSGHVDGTLVLPSNKDKFSKIFADRYKVPYENILAIGDSGVDTKLGYLQENRLGLAETEEQAEKVKPFFGEVVVAEDFFPALEWIKNKLDTM